MVRWLKHQWLRYRVWRFKRELSRFNTTMVQLQAAFHEWHRASHAGDQTVYLVADEPSDSADSRKGAN